MDLVGCPTLCRSQVYTVEHKAHLLELGDVLVKSYICQMCEIFIYFFFFTYTKLYVASTNLVSLDLHFLCFLGDYEVSVKFNDEHIPDSPFVVPVGSTSDDARRLTVSSLQVRH